MQKARLVLFDIGNVLFSLNPAHVAFPLETLGRGREVDASQAEERIQALKQSGVLERFERGMASAEEFCAEVRSVFQSRLSDQEIAWRYVRILGRETEGMLPLIEDLKRSGARVAALTNTDPIHLEVILKYPAVQALEAVVASCATGRKKPELEAYRDALERLSADPQETYFTDDLPANIEGAKAAGIRAEVFRGVDALRKALGM